MKRFLMVVALGILATLSAQAQFQFRAAGNVLNPVQIFSPEPDAVVIAVQPPDEVFTGWHWEVLFSRVGFGMHYGMNLYESDQFNSQMIDWKTDFFISYHPLRAGSIIDPFLEFGWGSVGSTLINDTRDAEYPGWDEAAEDDDTIALSLFTYAAAGLALDLEGFLIGFRVAYMPYQMQSAVVGSGVPQYPLQQLELGLFAGIAFGGH